MSAAGQILNPSQIDELCGIVHGILQQNKINLEDTLSNTVDLQNTSILRLYQLVVEEWGKKQKIIDNLCHFSLTMMATVQLLWEQKYEQNQKLQACNLAINTLQAENQQLTVKYQQYQELNDMYRQKISEAQTRIEVIADAKDRIEEFVKSQSCINFSQLIQSNGNIGLQKKCSACFEQESISLEASQLIKKNSKILSEKDSEIENLRIQKIKLEQRLQQAIEESQLAKMELELAQIAIKEALTYKTSYKSLLQQNTSRLSEVVGQQPSNIHYLNGQIDCHSNMEDSFSPQNKNLLSNEFDSKQDVIHFASTPCILLNESADSFNPPSNPPQSQEQDLGYIGSPFKKKLIQTSSNRQIVADPKGGIQFVQDCEQDTQFNENFQEWRPESQIIDERKVKEMISRFRIKQSTISDKQQTQQSSVLSNEVLQYQKYQQLSRLQQYPPQQKGESSISKFYSFMTNKVVKSRIKVK